MQTWVKWRKHLSEERQCGVNFLVEGNNTMARTRPRITDPFRSEVQRANHYATAAPQNLESIKNIFRSPLHHGKGWNSFL